MEWAVTLILSLSRAALTQEVPTAPQAHSGIQSASKVGPQGPWEECSTHSSRFVLVFAPTRSADSFVLVFCCVPKIVIGRIRAFHRFSALIFIISSSNLRYNFLFFFKEGKVSFLFLEQSGQNTCLVGGSCHHCV